MIKKIQLILVILGFCSTRSNALEVENTRGKGMQVMRMKDYLTMPHSFSKEMNAIAKKHTIELPYEYYWLYSFLENEEIHISGIIDPENLSRETYISLPQKKGTIYYAEGQEEIQRDQILHRLLILQNLKKYPKMLYLRVTFLSGYSIGKSSKRTFLNVHKSQR